MLKYKNKYTLEYVTAKSWYNTARIDIFVKIYWLSSVSFVH